MNKLKPCVDCGKPLKKSTESWPNYYKKERCIKCHTKRVSSNLNRSGSKPGEKHPCWKGGVGISKGGYLRQFTSAGKREYQHRLVMEKYLGRKLKFSEVVHHINGIKTDNRLENLMIVTRAEHWKYHREPHLVKSTDKFSSQG